MKNINTKYLITLLSLFVVSILALSACAPMQTSTEQETEEANIVQCDVALENGEITPRTEGFVWLPIEASYSGNVPDSVLSQLYMTNYSASAQSYLYPGQVVSIPNVNQQVEVSMVTFAESVQCQ